MLERKYDFKESEKSLKKMWSDTGIYKFDVMSTKEIYSIDTPPPTVSGKLHIGHIFSYTQAEMIARFQRMQGKNVFYPFGFDDNGLPTERLVEKEHNIQAKDIARSEFIRICSETINKYENEFKDLWQSLGFSVDWDLEYQTIGSLAQKIAQKSFLELAKKGRAYLKETPVLWCTTCQTSIAQAELEYTDRESTFNWIKFLVDDKEIMVATTRPELLYGCVALFVHPSDDRYKGLIGKKVLVPLYNFAVPIIADEAVDIDKGSGAVMCATFGDNTDVQWYEAYNLPYRKVITKDGCIDEGISYIGGLTIEKARSEIIRILKERGLLINSQDLTHSVAVHERCGEDVEIIPSKQWFIDILSHKEDFLDAADKINWYPKEMKNRYENWVQNLKWDWCISRQRYFGIPFPIWYCSDCGKVMYADYDELPINPMEALPDMECSCKSRSFVPESAVMDTWATSSLTPMINAKWGENDDISHRIMPMSMRTQAHEIIRTWAFYTIVKSIYHTGSIPWKDIMICGFVMSNKGEKISKSKENSSLSPTALIEKYSADAIRYWAANAKLGTDTMFSEDELKISTRFMTKLWNAARFSLSHLQDFSKVQDFHKDMDALLPIDRWIIQRSLQTMNNAAEYLEQYEVGAARHEIDRFFWSDFCDNYLEIVKDRLYKPEIYGEDERKSAQDALYIALLNILKMYAPFVPFITEEIYQSYFCGREDEISLHCCIWDKAKAIDKSLDEFGDGIMDLMATVRKHKAENKISLKAPINKGIIHCPGRYRKDLELVMPDLYACTNIKQMNIKEASDFRIHIDSI